MIVINRLCRNNSNKCLINYISTTATSRCEKPKDEINETEKKDGETNLERKGKQKAASKKMFELFENNFSVEKSSEAAKKLKTLKMSDTPVTKIVEVTQKMETKSKTRPADEAAKKAKSRLEYNLVKSAKKVADEFGGDVNKTDKELLGSLSKFLDTFERAPQKSDKKGKLPKEGGTDQKLTKPQGGKVGSRKTKETEKLKGILGSINIASLPKKEPKEPIEEFSDPVMLSDLLEKSEALNIFHPDMKRNNGAKLKIWDELERDELKYLVSSAPRNYYQELIKWTEEGKLWHFPINNEQGMDEEANVDFTEHVFLEDHLEPWCPKSGPLRHFMELVCVGLSKNPYLTVEDKREHIHWFRDYFEEKKRILQELGAMTSQKEIEQPKETETNQKTQ